MKDDSILLDIMERLHEECKEMYPNVDHVGTYYIGHENFDSVCVIGWCKDDRVFETDRRIKKGENNG